MKKGSAMKVDHTKAVRIVVVHIVVVVPTGAAMKAAGLTGAVTKVEEAETHTGAAVVIHVPTMWMNCAESWNLHQTNRPGRVFNG